MTPRKGSYLSPEEIPADLRPSIDFESQHRRPSDNRVVVQKICLACGNRTWRFPSQVRMLLKKGLYCGYCNHCWLNSTRAKPPLRPDEVEPELRPYINFENQPVESKQGRLVEVQCPGCGKRRMTLATFFRVRFLKSTYCHPCACAKDAPVKKVVRGGYIMVRISALSGHELELAKATVAHTKAGVIIEEHRLVMAMHLNRPLTPKEVVHHKNGDRADNRLENLELLRKDNHHVGHGVYYQKWQEALATIEILRKELANLKSQGQPSK